jgi:hypothetical protein
MRRSNDVEGARNEAAPDVIPERGKHCGGEEGVVDAAKASEKAKNGDREVGGVRREKKAAQNGDC